MKILIIGEKREAMCDMAATLEDSKLGSDATALQKKGKSNGFLEGDKYIITWAAGHLFRLEPPEKIKPEYALFNPLKSSEAYKQKELIKVQTIPDTDPTLYKNKSAKDMAKFKKRQLDIVYKQLARKDYDKIILAPDADAEGEAIGRDIVINFEKKKGKISRPIYRFWNTGSFKAKDAIQKALSGIETIEKDTYKNLYYAAKARDKADYLVGMKITKTISERYNRFFTAGRVQSPIISILCKREEEIKNFKPKTFYTIDGLLGDLKLSHYYIIEDEEVDEEGNTKIVKAKNRQYFDPNEKDKVIDDVKSANLTGTVESFTKKTTSTKSRPLPLSTGDFQSEMMKRYKISIKEADDILEYLRNEGYTTYPRTDGNYFSKADLKEVQDAIETAKTIFSDWNNKLSSVTAKNYIFNDKKAAKQNHTPLSITSKVPDERVFDSWKKSSKKYYEGYMLIASRIFAAFLPDDKIEKQHLEVDIANHKFELTGERVIELGWRKFLKMEKKDTAFNAELKTGDSVKFDNIVVNEGQTKKPSKFTVSSLLNLLINIGRAVDEMIIEENDPNRIAHLKEMKKLLKNAKGLGTNATRKTIIEDMISRGYIKTDKKQVITVTPDGRDLYKVLPNKLKDITLTAEWEQQLDEIRRGEMQMEEFVKRVDSIIMEDMISEVFNSKTGVQIKERSAVEKEETSIQCPKCGKPLIKSEKTYNCSGGKYDAKTKKRSGCDFVIFRENKVIGKTLNDDDVAKLIAGEWIKGDNGNAIELDLNNKFFTKAIWANNGTNNSNDSTDELIETPKAYKKNGKLVWKEFRGKKLTKTQAEKLLDGKKIKIKLKSKAGNDYEVFAWLMDDKGKIETEFA